MTRRGRRSASRRGGSAASTSAAGQRQLAIRGTADQPDGAKLHPVLHTILEFLDEHSRARVRLVSKAWNVAVGQVKPKFLAFPPTIYTTSRGLFYMDVERYPFLFPRLLSARSHSLTEILLNELATNLIFAQMVAVDLPNLRRLYLGRSQVNAHLLASTLEDDRLLWPSLVFLNPRLSETYHDSKIHRAIAAAAGTASKRLDIQFFSRIQAARPSLKTNYRECPAQDCSSLTWAGLQTEHDVWPVCAVCKRDYCTGTGANCGGADSLGRSLTWVRCPLCNDVFHRTCCKSKGCSGPKCRKTKDQPTLRSFADQRCVLVGSPVFNLPNGMHCGCVPDPEVSQCSDCNKEYCEECWQDQIKLECSYCARKQCTACHFVYPSGDLNRRNITMCDACGEQACPTCVAAKPDRKVVSCGSAEHGVRCLACLTKALPRGQKKTINCSAAGCTVARCIDASHKVDLVLYKDEAFCISHFRVNQGMICNHSCGYDHEDDMSAYNSDGEYVGYY